MCYKQNACQTYNVPLWRTCEGTNYSLDGGVNHVSNEVTVTSNGTRPFNHTLETLEFLFLLLGLFTSIIITKTISPQAGPKAHLAL